jgi:hypothetical protein
MTTSTLQCGCRSYLSKKQVIRREDSYSTAGLFVFTGVMRRMRQCGRRSSLPPVCALAPPATTGANSRAGSTRARRAARLRRGR